LFAESGRVQQMLLSWADSVGISSLLTLMGNLIELLQRLT
jgi:hypothetical protein